MNPLSTKPQCTGCCITVWKTGRGMLILMNHGQVLKVLKVNKITALDVGGGHFCYAKKATPPQKTPKNYCSSDRMKRKLFTSSRAGTPHNGLTSNLEHSVCLLTHIWLCACNAGNLRVLCYHCGNIEVCDMHMPYER